MVREEVLITLVGKKVTDKNLPNHSEVCKTTKHNLARIRTPVASRIVDHQAIPYDTSVYLTPHKPFGGIFLMNPSNQDTWFAYGIELGTCRRKLALTVHIICGDDSGRGDGLDFSPVTSHGENGLDMLAEVYPSQDRLTCCEI